MITKPLRLFACISALLATPFALHAEQVQEVDFGDDTSEWAKDGECDDPRFVGEGVSPSLVTENIGRDASDCSARMADGTATLNPLFAVPSADKPIDFGDNTSEYADNGVCDDIRFTGAYAEEMVYIVEDIGHDAADCRAAHSSGEATWQGNVTHPENGISVSAFFGS